MLSTIFGNSPRSPEDSAPSEDRHEKEKKSYLKTKLAATTTLVGSALATSYRYFPEQTSRQFNNFLTLATNIVNYPMQNSLSDAKESISFSYNESFFTKLYEGKKLLSEANPSYISNMLNVQTTLLLTATTFSAISLFASCLKSKKISYITKAGAYVAISATLLASYQYLNTASCMGSSMPDNRSSIQEVYKNCTK